MALFNDGPISTLEELRGYESAIYEVAATERIDLTRKLVLAQQELEVELTTRLFGENSGELARVAVTRPLLLWHTFQALALTYRDAYNSQFNDRYLGKWREYERLANWASRNLFETGVGMVGEPVSKAAPPELTTTAGNAAAAMYWVRAAWVGRPGEEGCPSEPSVLSAGQGAVPVARMTEAPANVSGWNVYAGSAIDEVGLQTASPIPIGDEWVMPASGLVRGRKPGNGQPPSSYKRIERQLRRG